MYVKTKDYIITYDKKCEYNGLTSIWSILLTKYPKHPFLALYNEDECEITLLYNTIYDEDEDYMSYINKMECKIKNAISFLSNNII